nr:amidophosphoribosyltransferase, chloroplastic-like [Tanacetum cinerariifolium]
MVVHCYLPGRGSSIPIDLFTAFTLTRPVLPVKKLTVHDNGDFMAIGRRRSRLCTCARVVTGGGGGLCGGDGEWHDGGDGEWQCLAKTLSDVNFFMERGKSASTVNESQCYFPGRHVAWETYGHVTSQHKGQECAGIVTATPDGFVYEVFDQSKLDQLPGNNAIGHV